MEKKRNHIACCSWGCLLAEAVCIVICLLTWVSAAENASFGELAAGDFGVPVQPEEKVIYLTFDDGPGAFTPRLLEILDKYQVKATFFVVNTECFSYTGDIARAGHTVAMHTDSHRYSRIYANETLYFKDLSQIQSAIYRYTGTRPTLLRFPGGSGNTVSRRYNRGIMTRLTEALKEMGYRYFDWNVDSGDASGAKTADAVYRNVVNQIAGKDVAIVLQHDIYDFSVAAVERIIRWGLANGYQFRALDTSGPVCEQPVRN